MLNHKPTLPEAADGWGIGKSYQSPSPLQEWINGSAVDPALASANIRILDPDEVLESLLGDRLERLATKTKYSQSRFYVTAAVRDLLTPEMEEVASAGWWCSGLDPDTDFRTETAWGCWKPLLPRTDSRRNRVIKYEHPRSAPTRLFFLRVPGGVARRIGHRWSIPAAAVPDDVLRGVDGAFWRWWKVETRLPLFITEGAKKAASLLSAGFPAIAVSGIWNGTAGKRLHPDLAGLPLEGRQTIILFDYSDSPRGQRDLRIASLRLGKLLHKEKGADVGIAMLAGPHKGVDDVLAAGLSLSDPSVVELLPLSDFERFHFQVEGMLRREPDQLATTQYLADSVVIPADAPLVLIKSGMGSGKSRLIQNHVAPVIATGERPVLGFYHRRSLASADSVLMGVGFGAEAAPGSPIRHLGLFACVDSLHPDSVVSFHGDHWGGSIVLMDEITQQVDHLLNGKTAIAKVRPAAIAHLTEALMRAHQIIGSDALLDNDTVSLMERLTGRTAHVIGSTFKPSEGRRCFIYGDELVWLANLEKEVKAGKPVFVTCTAADAGSTFSVKGLSALIRDWVPGIEVLEVDSSTVNDPNHPAAQLVRNPREVAARYRVIVASPATETGLSVDLVGHFGSVFSHASGATSVEGVAQAMNRVRDGMDRHLYAPERSPGSSLQVGNGGLTAEAVRKGQDEQSLIVRGLLSRAAEFNPEFVPMQDVWFDHWCQLAAKRNLQALHYRTSLLTLVESEGYELVPVESSAADTEAGKQIRQSLREQAKSRLVDQCERIATAEPITPAEAKKLEDSDHLTESQRLSLKRHQLQERYGTTPTPELAEADRQGIGPALRLHYWLTVGREKTIEHDLKVVRKHASSGRYWAPDVHGQTVTDKVELLTRKLDLPYWLAREGFFTADDEALNRLADLCRSHQAILKQILGTTFLPTARATTILQQLLNKVGYQLVRERVKSRNGGTRDEQQYRIEPIPLPSPMERQTLYEYWLRRESE